ncbi:MAG: cation:proton antiporter [Clostridia bacterium]|nr:cation:proton antiporter [Clostridia bacterium]
MEYYSVLLPLAIILVLSKVLVKFCERLNLPSVVGMLLAGIIIGFVKFIPGQDIITATSLEGLGFIAKIGVIFIMFNAGLGTDIKSIKSIGVPAILITAAGVIVPMGLGFVVACLFNGGFGVPKEVLLSNLFYGVILTATSVSVTVATLREMGKLHGKVGDTIVAAAILDDIIGVIVLSVVIGFSGTGANAEAPSMVILKTVLFFIAAIIVGYICNKLFRAIEHKFPHHRLLPILSVALCFFFAYASEAWFGVADITGAFVAGIVLSGNPEVNYIERKSDIMGYMIFTPVFFANIGITTEFGGISTELIFFGVCFIVAGLIGKVIGCGTAAIACKYGVRDSLKVGIGMMARAEVALVCAQKGAEFGMINTSIMPFIVILIVISSFTTPIVLRKLYRKELEKEKAAQAVPVEAK